MASGSAPVMRLDQWGALLLLALIWSSSFLFYRLLAPFLPPCTIVFARLGLAALLLQTALALHGRMPRLGWRRWLDMAGFATIGIVVPFSLFAWAEQRIDAGTAAITNATMPIFAVLLAHALRHEKLTAWRLGGVLLGLAGVTVMVSGAGTGAHTGTLAGEAAGLFASVLYAFAGQYARRFSDLPPAAVTAAQATASAVLLLPLAALEHPWTRPVPPDQVWLWLGLFAVICTVVAYTFYFWLIARIGPTNTSLVTLVQPIGTLSLGWIVLGEIPGPGALHGLLLILLGLALLDRRPVAFLASVRSRA